MKGYIYKFTNLINNKIYIGQTVNIKRRFKDHKNAKSNVVFHKAIRKYGFDNFKFEILYEFDFDNKYLLKKTLDNLEIHFIQIFDSFHNGYNMTEGGAGALGLFFTEESRQKLSKAAKGRVFTEEHKQKISEAQKGENGFWYGKKHTEEQKQKVSESLKGNHNGKGYVHTDEELKHLSELNNGENNPMFGKKHTAEAIQKMRDGHKGKSGSKCKKIQCIETQKIYKSQKEAADDIHCTYGKMSRHLNKEASNINGLHFVRI